VLNERQPTNPSALSSNRSQVQIPSGQDKLTKSPSTERHPAKTISSKLEQASPEFGFKDGVSRGESSAVHKLMPYLTISSNLESTDAEFRYKDRSLNDILPNLIGSNLEIRHGVQIQTKHKSLKRVSQQTNCEGSPGSKRRFHTQRSLGLL